MSLKGKVPPELKIQAVEDYIAVRKGSTQIKEELGIRLSTFQSWLRKYQMEGLEGLYPKKGFTAYPAELKLGAAHDYLSGGGSLDAMCRKYGISSHAVLQQWITLYNEGHRDFKMRRAQEESSMTESKKKRYIVTEPRITAENLLNRDFTAGAPNQKWLTDITEFKLSNGKKAYLSAILDLHDKSIISYVPGHSGNNQLVFETLNKAAQANTTAHPLFHSDRGLTYTNRQFKAKLDKIHATQSMSRPGRGIDNGPMGGFWGIIKAEMFYLNQFHTFEELQQAIEAYILFYNTRRLQSKLKGLAPLDFRNQTLVA